MTGIVIDASVALAWCFPDEASEYADGVLVALEGRAILVPALWSVEITNAVLMAERRNESNNLKSGGCASEIPGNWSRTIYRRSSQGLIRLAPSLSKCLVFRVTNVSP